MVVLLPKGIAYLVHKMKQHLKTSANFMKINLQVILCFAALIMFANELLAQIYPDQHYLLRIDSLKTRVETSENVKLSDDGK